MKRRQAKKILLGVTRRGWGAARARWMRDLKDPERRLGRWCPVPREMRARRRAALTPGAWRLWWLSFVGPQGFLGACQVWADCYMNAVKTAHAFGCNPGGEVQGHSAQDIVAKLVPAKYIGVLMSRHECEIFDALLDEIIADAKLKGVGVAEGPIVTRRQ